VPRSLADHEVDSHESEVPLLKQMVSELASKLMDPKLSLVFPHHLMKVSHLGELRLQFLNSMGHSCVLAL
jgi:hypothetical protein